VRSSTCLPVVVPSRHGVAVLPFTVVSDSINLNAYLGHKVLMLDIGKDVRSLSDFKRNTGELLEQIRGSGHPLVLTINGRRRLWFRTHPPIRSCLIRSCLIRSCLIALTNETLQGIRRGLADVEAGRVTTLRKFAKELGQERGLPSRSR